MRLVKKMGRKFRLYIIVECLFLTVYPAICSAYENGRNVILPPGQPRISLPPVKEESEAAQDLRNLKRRRNNRDKKSKFKKITPEAKKTIELEKESLKEKPFLLHMSASLVLPYVKTTGSERERYDVEPTAFYHFFLRPSADQLSDNTTLWTGFRVAPICGSGVYKKVAGRFCFLNFGPMVGVGKISLGTKSIGHNSGTGGEVKRKARLVHSRDGLFAMVGISAQNKQSRMNDAGVGDQKEDLRTEGIAFDSPGIWSEVYYFSIKYNSISSNYFFGLQLGKKKVFAYLGIGMGFWY